MDASNLSWKQIKELAQIAMDNHNEFCLDINKDGDISISISKPYYRYQPITTTPSIVPDTWKPYVWCGDPISTITTTASDDCTKVTC